VIVGGAPVSEAWARQIGADAYGYDAASAVERIRALTRPWREEAVMTNNLLARLAAGEVLVGDGAWGTMLLARGLRQGEPPESLNLTRPELLEEIASLYLDAGADLVTTNTFGGSRRASASSGSTRRRRPSTGPPSRRCAGRCGAGHTFPRRSALRPSDETVW